MCDFFYTFVLEKKLYYYDVIRWNYIRRISIPDYRNLSPDSHKDGVLLGETLVVDITSRRNCFLRFVTLYRQPDHVVDIRSNSFLLLLEHS